MSKRPSRKTSSCNVLHLTYSKPMGGGIEQFVYRLLDYFQTHSLGIEPYSCCLGSSSPSSLGEALEALMPSFRRFQPFGPKAAWMLPVKLLAMAAFVWRRRIAWVHVHDMQMILLLTGIKVLCPFVRVVATVHSPDTFNMLAPWHLRIARRVVDQWVLVGDAMKELAESRHIGRYRVITNGVVVPDERELTPMPARLSEPSLKLLCVSRLAPGKRHDVLIEAIALCRQSGYDVQCDCLGGEVSYNRAYGEGLKQRVVELGLDQALRFWGERDDVPAFLDNAHVLVMPSEMEGFSLAVIEALSRKTPVIASDIEALRAQIRSDETGWLFEVGNPQALAGILVHLANHREHLLSASEAAYHDARVRFGYDTMVSRYCDLYYDRSQTI